MELLQASSTMFNVRIAAFGLMLNHYKLLLQTPDANFSRLVRHVDGVYTQRFNRLHKCDGSLFRVRYKAIVVPRAKAGFQSLRSHREIPASRSLAPGLEDIQSAVCASFGLDRKVLLWSRRGMSNVARNVALYLARRLSRQTLAGIGVAFGLENYSSVSGVACRMEQRVGKDRSLRRKVEAIERRIL
jgi:hypothetical protein